MIKQIAWNTFKNTGDINTMMELIEVDKVIENEELNKETNELKNIVKENSDYGYNKNKGNNFSTK